MTEDKQIKDLKTLPQLILAGNALLTFLSINTGKHFTFHIHQTHDVTVFNVYHNNEKIGQIISLAFHIHPKAVNLSPAQTAFAWIWKNLINVSNLEHNVKVYHNGLCARCGRKLTVPSSIESGIGPECSKLIFK